MNNRAPALFPEAGGSDDGWLPANTGPGGLDGDNITPGSDDIIVGGEYSKCGIVVLRRPPMYSRSWPVKPVYISTSGRPCLAGNGRLLPDSGPIY